MYYLAFMSWNISVGLQKWYSGERSKLKYLWSDGNPLTFTAWYVITINQPIVILFTIFLFTQFRDNSKCTNKNI